MNAAQPARQGCVGKPTWARRETAHVLVRVRSLWGFPGRAGRYLALTKMRERWKDIPGYEARYQVSDLGRVKSLSFMQRYLLRNGKEAFRRVRERLLAQHPNNGGYLMVKLHLDNVMSTFTVHRLVACAFVPNTLGLPEVNHKDGVKANCKASNLEWVTRSGNKNHAVDNGLNPLAIQVIDPKTGTVYPSINRAAQATCCSAKTVRKTWVRT